MIHYFQVTGLNKIDIKKEGDRFGDIWEMEESGRKSAGM